MPTGASQLTGLRNPWRFAFDPALGEVWIGDVGQDDVEEVNRVLLEPDEPPKNLGWDAFEGDRPTEGDDFALDRTGELVWPVASYTHQDGCSVIGGYVYRGTGARGAAGRATSTATSAPARCGRSSARRRAAPTTSAASARRCSSSPTSARTPTASPSSRPRRARSIAPSRRASRRRRSSAFTGPSTHTRTRSPGCQAGKAEPAAAQAQPARQLEVARAGRGRRTSAHDHARLGVVAVRRLEADRHGLRAEHDVDGAVQRARHAEAAELALDDAGGRAVRAARRPRRGTPPASGCAGARRSPPGCRPARPPGAHHRHGVGERERLGLVVGDEQRARPRRPAGSRRTSWRSESRRPASSAANGSSSSTTSGSRRARARARSAGARRPTARAGRRRRAAASPTSSRHSATRSARAAPKPTLPATVRCGKSAPSWKTIPTRRCSGSTHAPSPATGRPAIATGPRPAPRSRRSPAAAWSCPSRSVRAARRARRRQPRCDAPSTARVRAERLVDAHGVDGADRASARGG